MSAAVETGLFLDGLRCAGCVARAERSLAEIEGVEHASVNYTTHRALVRFDPARVDTERLVSRIAELGYSAVAYDPASLDRPAEREARAALVRVLVAAFLAMNVMLVAAALYIGSYQDIDAITRRGLRWLALALSLPAATWCAAPFWKGAWAGLRRREIGMDVPIVLGIATSFGIGVAGTLAETPHLFIDSAAMIVFLILLGRTLERRARARAAGAVERLTALTPRRALRVGPAGVEEVAVETLAPGDRVVVPPGETVPTDGSIQRGASEIDESMLTGESMPVLRGEGAAVSGGTRNLLAELEIRVTAAVAEGTVARLSALLERAQAEKPQIQRLADRIAGWFAPAVVAIALATAAGHLAFGASAFDAALAAAAVLIVACPCALGLATPAAVTAAVGRAAALGILVKRGDALEQCARTDTALLDKTGTLTEGRVAVRELVTDPGVSEEELISKAASAEGESTHPLAAAIRGLASERNIEIPPCSPREVRPGLGVVAGDPATPLRVGARALLTEKGVRVDAALEARAARLAEAGHSLAWVAEGDRALGAVAVSDPPRPDATDAVAQLWKLGVRVGLVTGDHAGAAQLAAGSAGIADVHHDVSPDEKVALLRERRAAGARVLLAGDGINDAAALAAADVGVAMAEGSDVTLHAADVVVRSPRLTALADLIGLSRATLRRVRENLGFALVYNAVAVPLAVAGVLEPLHAAVAMSLSSLAVTANAVRLLRWEPPR